MPRLPHFLDNQLIDGLTCRPPLTPRKIPGTHFCYRLRQSQGHSADVRIRSPEKSNDISNRTRDLLASSTVPQPSTLQQMIVEMNKKRTVLTLSECNCLNTFIIQLMFGVYLFTKSILLSKITKIPKVVILTNQGDWPIVPP
jgi:hypothetical protein